jgi:hypothetical protein
MLDDSHLCICLTCEARSPYSRGPCPMGARRCAPFRCDIDEARLPPPQRAQMLTLMSYIRRNRPLRAPRSCAVEGVLRDLPMSFDRTAEFGAAYVFRWTGLTGPTRGGRLNPIGGTERIGTVDQ